MTAKLYLPLTLKEFQWFMSRIALASVVDELFDEKRAVAPINTDGEVIKRMAQAHEFFHTDPNKLSEAGITQFAARLIRDARETWGDESGVEVPVVPMPLAPAASGGLRS